MDSIALNIGFQMAKIEGDLWGIPQKMLNRFSKC